MYSDAAHTQLWTDKKFTINQNDGQLIIDNTIADQYSVFLKGTSLGLKTISIEVKVLICDEDYRYGLPESVTVK